MTTYSDAYLEYYADRFVQQRFSRLGITLAQYLANVEACEKLLTQPRALAPEPLLPAQQKVALKLWQRWDTGLADESAEDDDMAIQAEAWSWRDLVDRWREEVAEAERALERMSQRNGAFVEPMRHHRHHGRNRAAANFSKRGA